MEYTTVIDDVRPEHLVGFFEGWPVAPSAQRHLTILRGSSEVVLARTPDGAVVGFITAITDGSFAAAIPLLEVVADHRGRGIGTELVERMLATLDGYSMVGVTCDPDVAPFYERFGFRPYSAMILRNRP